MSTAAVRLRELTEELQAIGRAHGVVISISAGTDSAPCMHVHAGEECSLVWLEPAGWQPSIGTTREALVALGIEVP